MTDHDARALGRTIVSTTNGVRVSFGKTNGRVCLHLLGSRETYGEAWSETIYSEEEWKSVKRTRRPRQQAVAA